MEKAPKAPLNPKVKPALKHPVETKAEANANADKHPDRHLTWDEHAIEEHDLLRGTRMKVSSCLYYLQFELRCYEMIVIFDSEHVMQIKHDMMRETSIY